MNNETRRVALTAFAGALASFIEAAEQSDPAVDNGIVVRVAGSDLRDRMIARASELDAEAQDDERWVQERKQPKEGERHDGAYEIAQREQAAKKKRAEAARLRWVGMRVDPSRAFRIGAMDAASLFGGRDW